MTKKNVDDYLQEGMYGTRLPKEAERKHFLGTLRERVILALTIGEVMSDRGLEKLEIEMKKHPNSTLLMNGSVAYKFLKQERDLADKYKISHTTISNQEHQTEIGAVLTYDHAIDKEDIYLSNDEDLKESDSIQEDDQKEQGIVERIKSWFK